MKKLKLSLIFLISGILLPLPFEVNTANAHGLKTVKKAEKEISGGGLYEKNGKWYHSACFFRLTKKHYHDSNGKKKGC